MENTKYIKLMSSSEFDEARKKCNTVIIPLGAIEVYGPHMPMGTDIIVSSAIADLLSKELNVMIGPSLEVGESYSLSLYPGTMFLRPETFKAVIEDYMQSLMEWGFKNFLFINGHAGNVPLVGHVCRPLERKYGIKTAQVDLWRFVQDKAIGVCEHDGWMAHGHASECGTSVMMHLYPEYVEFQKAEKVLPKEGENYEKYGDFIEYTAFNETTKNGILGDATIASPEKGELIVKKSLDRIIKFMKERFDSV